MQFRELVAHSQNGISKRRSSTGNPIPVLRLADIREGRINESASRDIKLSDEEVNKYVLRDGDLLCIRVNGSRSLTGRLVYFKTPKVWAYCDHFIRFRVNPEISDSKYIAYYFQTEAVRAYLNKHMVSTAGQNTVSQGTMLDIAVPVPPVHQQQTVVGEIEKQFSRLDEAVANLKRVKANLKRYKAAVLKAAVEGKLTEDWRKQHPNVEPAGKLLERILAERRAKWTGRGKYKEPGAPDTNDLPSLPKAWAWATVAQVAAPEPNSITDGPFGTNLKTAHYTATGPRVIRLQNIGEGVFVNEEAHISEEHFARLLKHRIFAGDLVIAALGEDPPRSCLVPQSVGHAIVKADCIRFKPHRDAVARYLNAVLNSEPTRQRAKSIVHGVGRPRLNLGEIKAIVVPLPPTIEQQDIVAEVERRLSVIVELETAVEANLKRADRLRQAILSQAFSGRLLGQDTKHIPDILPTFSVAAESQARYGRDDHARR
ncbi:MAG: restriction endonuclease subunit S [Nitrospirota bacterium]|nr:restriction endonuclease subunit S [Nitrospirota bacterium]